MLLHPCGVFFSHPQPSRLMIYVAALLCDLGIRPIPTTPVTAPLPACLLKTESPVWKRQLSPQPRKHKRGSKALRRTGEEAVICRAGGRGSLLLWRGSRTARAADRNICRALGCTARLLPLWRHAADEYRWKRAGPVWTKATLVTCERRMHENPAGLAQS